MSTITEKDWLLLSRYLTGALSDRQMEVLEMRLSSESDLATALLELKRIKALLARLPEKPVPHNFTISSKSLPDKQITRVFPIFRLAAAVCSILFVITVAIRIFATPIQSNQALLMAAPAGSMQAAPKQVVSAEDTISATSEANLGSPPMAGAGAPSMTLPTQERERNEEYVEEPVPSKSSSIPWVQITWALGVISLAMGAAAIFFYFQEHL